MRLPAQLLNVVCGEDGLDELALQLEGGGGGAGLGFRQLLAEDGACLADLLIAGLLQLPGRSDKLLRADNEGDSVLRLLGGEGCAVNI